MEREAIHDINDSMVKGVEKSFKDAIELETDSVSSQKKTISQLYDCCIDIPNGRAWTVGLRLRDAVEQPGRLDITHGLYHSTYNGSKEIYTASSTVHRKHFA